MLSAPHPQMLADTYPTLERLSGAGELAVIILLVPDSD